MAHPQTMAGTLLCLLGKEQRDMGIFLTGKDLLEAAIRIEKAGAAFYETMAGCARSQKARTAFQYLADEEKRHVKAYQDMFASLAEAPAPDSYTQEYDQYLKTLTDTGVFSSEAAACSLAEKTASDAEGIDFGIRAEKDSILFYTELQNLVRRSDAGVISGIIDEERSHLKRLSELKAGLARA